MPSCLTSPSWSLRSRVCGCPGASRGVFGYPPAVDLRMNPRRQPHGGERALVEPRRIEDQQVIARVEPAIDDANEVAVTLGRTRVSRHEAAFLQARVGPDEEARGATGRVVETGPAVERPHRA